MALYDRDPVYQQAFKLVDYTPARHVNIIMPWIGVYHGEMDVIQWTW